MQISALAGRSHCLLMTGQQKQYLAIVFFAYQLDNLEACPSGAAQFINILFHKITLSGASENDPGEESIEVGFFSLLDFFFSLLDLFKDLRDSSLRLHLLSYLMMIIVRGCNQRREKKNHLPEGKCVSNTHC